MIVDIEIVGAEPEGANYLVVARTLDGELNLERMPRETLAIRAAEYDLEPDDDFILDMVLLERFDEPEDPEELHPLFATSTIKGALKVMHSRIDVVRTTHGAPRNANRVLARAVANGAASKGLVRAQKLLIKNADRDVDEPVRKFRDRERERLARMAAATPLDQGMAATLRRELRRAEREDEMSARAVPEPLSIDAGTNDPESNEGLSHGEERT
jgi:hypothetical protein